MGPQNAGGCNVTRNAVRIGVLAGGLILGAWILGAWIWAHRPSTIIDLALAGNLNGVACLVRLGVSPDTHNEFGLTPLDAAVIAGHTQIVGYLLDHGANPNGVKEAAETPLHEAADIGETELAEVLLRHGADVNPKDRICGGTPLDNALEPMVGPPHLETAKLLRAHGGVKALSESRGPRILRR
jgi:hypothetical protein